MTGHPPLWGPPPGPPAARPGQPRPGRTLLLVVIVLVVAVTLVVTRTGGPDTSSPRATAQTWAEAVNGQDVPTLLTITCADDGYDGYVEELTGDLKANPDLRVDLTDVQVVSATKAIASFRGTGAPELLGSGGDTLRLPLAARGGAWLVCGTVGEQAG